MIRKRGVLKDQDISDLLDVLDPSNSDLEFDNDDNEADIQTSSVPACEEEEEDEAVPDDDNSSVPTADTSRGRDVSQRWHHKNQFPTPRPSTQDPSVAVDSTSDVSVRKPFEYFEQYLKDDFFEEMAQFTNRRYVLLMGKSLNTTPDEVRTYWGASIAVALIGFPKIRMCWEQRTRYPLIADHISRDRFYLLRSNLKIVDDNATSNDVKSADRYWKVRPMLTRIRNACLQHPRPDKVSVDEQMVPFHGQVRMKQYVKGKPQPVGLKNFVLTTPFGLPLDFTMYEGGGREIVPDHVPVPEKLDIGGKVVLKLSDTLPEGSTIFMDRFFTSIPLLETLVTHRSILGCGTIMRSRIPRSVELKRDNVMKREGRGSSDQVVRMDEKVSIVKWFDNRPIYLASTVHGVLPIENCRRWSKKDGQYIQVPRPYLVKMYNTNMGGVDLLDRILSKYAMRSRTNKWTIRTLHHFFDFVLAAAWIEYRQAALENKWKRKEILTYFQFKLDIAEQLIFYHNTKKRGQDEEEGEVDEDEEVAEPKSCKRTPTQPLPPVAKRIKYAMHLPEMMNNQQNSRSRCRAPGCSRLTFVRCTECKVFLCFTLERNCFNSFHTN